MWKRISVAPGVELHLRDNLPRPKPSALKELLVKMDAVMRKNL